MTAKEILKILKAELQKVEVFFEGKGYRDTFKGNRDDWKDYRERVNGVYGRYDRQVSHCFRDTRTADGLTYERWHYLHSQFEEILGHKVEVWRSVLEKWEKESQKREAAAKAKEMSACTILFGGGKMMSGGGARGDRTHL